MASATQFVYLFGSRHTEGQASMKNLLGGKGANLAEMCRLGIPVPAAFTISTEACTMFTELGRERLAARARWSRAQTKGPADDCGALSEAGRAKDQAAARRRRAMPAAARPRPSSASVPGSGTAVARVVASRPT